MRKLFFKSMLLLCALIVGTSSVWAQSDYSATYTSNVTLPTSGTQATSCTISIGGKNYTGTKLGKSGGGGAASITAPIGTRYIHLHVAAWNGKSPNFTYKVGSGTAQTIDGITSNTGIANSSPFTWGTTAGNSNPNSTNHYKVIDLGSALESATTITFASGSERVVFWGVNTEAAAVAISSIAFSEPKTASVGVGGTTTLTPTVLPANHTEVVDWESDATGVATVNSSGVVTGVAAGIAHITAKAHDNPSTIYDVCTITVTAPVAVTSVSLKSSTTLLLGGTETLEATVLPNDATNKNVSWSSADDTKVSVDENGVITGLALTNGTPVNITVTTEDGGKTAVCAVTVNPIPVSSVSLDKTSGELIVGKTLTLSETVSPGNATNKSVTWESDDETVATVDEDGKVTAVAEGTVKITVKSVADPTKKAECTITVREGSINLSTTGEITFGSWSTSILGSSYGDRECALTGSDDNTYYWNEVDGYYNNGGWQIKNTSGKVTSPVIKSNYGFTISTTKGTNNVTISDGTNSGQNSLTTTKTNTAITIKGDGTYAVFTSITITPLKAPIATDVVITDPGTLTKGETGIFIATFTNAAEYTKEWASSDADVIEIKNASTGAYEVKKKGSATITLTITPVDGTNYRAVSANLSATVVNPSHNVKFYDNETEITESAASVEEGSAITFPSNPTPSVYGYRFIGWATAAIDGSVAVAPSTVTSANMGEADVNYYAVYGNLESSSVVATFTASDITNTPSAGTRKWEHTATGITLYISSGQRYTGGTPNTFTVNSGTDKYFEIETVGTITSIVATLSESSYKINTVSPGELSTNGTTQTITLSGDVQSVKCYATSSNQIRATQIVVNAVTDVATSYCTTLLNSVSGTITTCGWSSFASSKPLDVSSLDFNSGSGIAYYASNANGNEVTLTALNGDEIVPAGEGLMIKGTANTTFTFNTASAKGTALSGNKLKGQTITGTVDASNKNSNGKYHYVFGYESSSVYGFYNLLADTEVSAGKAYLETTTALTAQNAPAIIRILDEENNATSTERIDGKNDAIKFIENGHIYILREGVVYDALGRKVH